ncbi:MAG TPA: bifunctional UDP-N-acetylmuramoyl-tripeptide:D-alanyl-D-alanine ligase/alanine racemase [Bacteroides sp.]|nr:bifunctional UDP-N-acetylmuramoyl-tripeptide:D-alanyl-D-alanine ligase/alanine racemase [Bacteroides sp.]
MEFELSIGNAAGLLHGSVTGNGQAVFRNLAVDSRTLAQTEFTLFVALVGDRHDGHDYLEELYRRGIRAFLVSRLPRADRFPEAGFCLVEDTLTAMQELALARRRAFNGMVAAVTGSNGKTIVKEWIYQCLQDQTRIFRSPKSYNSQVGVPLSLWMISDNHELALLEAGISRPGEMARLEQTILPGIGLFTNLGTAHQENFRDLEEKLREKLILFKNCEKVICRSDQVVGQRPLLEFLAEMKPEVVDWSLGGEAIYRYIPGKREPFHTEITMHAPAGDASFHLPFSDEASIENALHALTFILEMGIPLHQAIHRIGEIEPVSMRLEMLQGILGSVIINDAYNADIGGLASALDLMNQQDKQNGKVLILSDLLQSGMADRELYGEIARLIGQKGVDHFIGIGPALMRHRKSFPWQSRFFPDTADFVERMDKTFFRDKTVLIKGSRKFGFERITRELQLKTHQTLLEIDLNAMVHNLNTFRSILKDGVKTMVIVKALSYGSGNVEIANLLQFHKVEYLAVAFIDEGVDLRRAGIYLPIMVMNPDPSGFGQMLDYQLEPEIYSFGGLQRLFEVLRYRGMKQYPVHVKLDTGMHRLGFMEDEIERLLPLLNREAFRVVSVFTHLAASDDPLLDRFTREQIRDFDRMTAVFSAMLGEPYARHVLNSSGIERFPDAQYEMVRLGIGLHGIGKDPALKPSSSFRTRISQLRKVKAGETVGYSRAGKLDRESLIATLPVGYADGLNRKLGNGAGKLWIAGTLVPTVGNICMDMTMIDVTGLDVTEGQEVEIFGKHQSVTEISRLCGTIPYEMLTSIPPRVKRVYLQE